MKAADRNFQGIWIPKRIYLNQEVNWYAKILFLEIHSFNPPPSTVRNATCPTSIYPLF